MNLKIKYKIKMTNEDKSHVFEMTRKTKFLED